MLKLVLRLLSLLSSLLLLDDGECIFWLAILLRCWYLLIEVLAMTLSPCFYLGSLRLSVGSPDCVADTGLLHVVLPTDAKRLLVLTLVDDVHTLGVIGQTTHHLCVSTLLGVVLVLISQQPNVAVLIGLGLKALLGALAVSLFVLFSSLGLTKLVFEL